MPYIKYQNHSFNAETLRTIEVAEQICKDYAAMGYDLTLRQLYYQFVAKNLIENTERSYKRLGSIINDARLAGLIDWNHIVDRTRHVRRPSAWDDAADIIESASKSFRLDIWIRQAYRPIVMIEKDALIGVIEGPCTKWRVPYFACRGYSSQSEIWAIAMRMTHELAGNYGLRGFPQTPIVFYLGDHDPSGIDMTRDIKGRLEMFSENAIEVIRLALNMDQVKRYNPPPNPAKLSDTRANGYISKHGEESWELDSLEPQIIASLVEKSIRKLINKTAWEDDIKTEREKAETIHLISERWDELEALVNGEGT